MVSADSLLSYPNWTIAFMVRMYAFDKQLGSVISQYNKLIAFLSIILSKQQLNNNTTEKELHAVVEYPT